MDEQATMAAGAALLLAAVHVFGGRLGFLGGVPRNAWLSAFAGVSVAYVFGHLLPELADGQRAVDGEGHGPGPLLGFLEHHVYLVALIGLVALYGVEQHAVRSRRTGREAEDAGGTTPGAFWFSMASFAVYNAIVGYLLLRGELEDAGALALYTFALGVHFVINDFALREHHRHRYHALGRWIIAAAVLLGWLLGMLTTVPERAIGLVLGFIAGGVVLNVMKEELPRERQARFAPFVAGAAAYAALLQVA